ncbi:MAG: hypothetical protein DMD82_12515, partial [Candidatus Rokuibacteriota bacterium]
MGESSNAPAIGLHPRENTRPSRTIFVPEIPRSSSDLRCGERGLKNGPSVSAGVGSSSSPQSGVGATQRAPPGAEAAASVPAAARPSSQRNQAPEASTMGATRTVRRNLRRLELGSRLIIRESLI